MSQKGTYGFRNSLILHQITAATGTNIVDIYTPGIIQPSDYIEGLKYSGFITSLRMMIDIDSLSPAIFPPIPESALPEEVERIMAEVARLSNFKNLKVYDRREGQPIIELVTIQLYRRDPYYYIDLMPYFTNANTIDVAPNEVLSVGLAEPLIGADRIVIRGSAIEEGLGAPPNPIFAQQFQSWQRNISNTPSVVLVANNERKTATFVNSAIGDGEEFIIWLRRGWPPEVGKGIPLFPNGSSFEINQNNFYPGSLSAVSISPTTLIVEEGI